MQKCKGRRKRENSRMTPAIRKKELLKKKRGAFFSLYKFYEKLIEYVFELLCEIDLIDAENLRVYKG